MDIYLKELKGDTIDIMQRYIFSGSLTDSMHDRLLELKDFEPLDILVSQVDKSGVKKALKWKKEGFCKFLFIDSGAFSIHTGNYGGGREFKELVDEYIEFLNSIDDDIDVFAQLDTIPGKFQQPKTKEDYIESARKSWENYLYMRERVKSPHKLMPVYHYGESPEALKSMLEWHADNGDRLDYVGLSPANDVSQREKNVYLQEMADIIAASSNPKVKTHLYGMTSLDALSKYPCYSADSISHRLISGYAKILSPHFGVISVSKNERTSATKSNLSFVDTADEHNLDILKTELEDCGFTLEEIQESSSARTVFTMHSIQVLMKTKYKFDENKVRKTHSLFKLPS